MSGVKGVVGSGVSSEEGRGGSDELSWPPPKKLDAVEYVDRRDIRLRLEFERDLIGIEFVAATASFRPSSRPYLLSIPTLEAETPDKSVITVG